MRRLAEVRVDGTIFTLRGWQAHKLALDAGLHPTYNGVRGAWVADTKKLPQFIAYCEYRNVALTVDEGTPDVLREPADESSNVLHSSPDVDLELPFGGGGDAA